MLNPSFYRNKSKFDINTMFFRSLKNYRCEQKKLFFIPFIQNSLFLQIQKFYFKSNIFTFLQQKFALKNKKLTRLLGCSSLLLNSKFFTKYFYNGLGYKIFLRGFDLFVWVGLTHYTILRVPEGIKIFPKKKRIFIVGNNLIKFKDFLMRIRRIRKIDLYKGKGLLEIKSYKGFIKMKSGKKKQY